MAYQVECVTTDGEPDDCRDITTIGIPAKGGGTNEYTPEQIHDRIEDDNDEFYVKHNGSKTDVDAVTESDGTKYVRTMRNDTKDDNLLKQDSC